MLTSRASEINLFRHMKADVKESDINKMKSVYYDVRKVTLKSLRGLSKLPSYACVYVGKYRDVRFGDDKIVKTGFGDILYTKDTSKISEFRNELSQISNIYDKTSNFRHNFSCKQLEKLQRCRLSFKKLIENGSTFSRPINMHFEFLSLLQKDSFSASLMKLVTTAVNIIISHCKNTSKYVIIDDVIRSLLSEVDDILFVASYESFSVSQHVTNFHGMSTFGGARGWTDDDIYTSITDWVSGIREYGTKEASDFKNAFYDSKISEWCRRRPKEKMLSFDEFCTDPMRWATSGGAPKVSLGGEEVRSKWAWALDKLKTTSDLYGASLKERKTASVALKEEKKTRTVITTPMASYLRQCYMLYVLGTPEINSTMHDSTLTEYLARSNSKYYMSIDASKFDHTVSKSEIMYIFALIKKYEPSLSDLIDEELKDMDSLHISWNDRTWKYENGLLSGWRFTSLIGSLRTCALSAYIQSKTNIKFDYITQGDDIIIFSQRDLDKDAVLRNCEDFGILTNKSKTTNGPFGEFLKYRYSQKFVSGYCCRNIRSIFYANPWLDASIDVKPSDISSKWFNYISRLCMCRNSYFGFETLNWIIKNRIAKDVFSWMGRQVKFTDVLDCLKTPTTMGGMAPVEILDYGDVVKSESITVMKERDIPGDLKFYSAFVGLKNDRIRLEKKFIKKTSSTSIAYATKYVLRDIYSNTSYERMKHEKNTNIFRSILETILRGRSVPIIPVIARHCIGEFTYLDKFYPRYLRKTHNWYERLKMLMSNEDIGAPYSMFGSLRYDGYKTRYIKMMTSRFFDAQRTLTAESARYVGAFAIHLYQHTQVVLNTP